MNIAYISGAYRSKYGVIGRIINILKARQAAKRLWKEYDAVICPHLNTALFDGVVSDDKFLKGDIEILNRLHRKDTIYMMDGWENSEGAKMELDVATRRGLTVRYQGSDDVTVIAMYDPMITNITKNIDESDQISR
jgi:hypothetical protein